MMEYIEPIIKFGILGGTALASSEIFSILMNSRKSKKLANNELKTHKEIKKLKGSDGIILSDNIQLDKKLDYEGICIVGATGSGKTTKHFFTNLLSNNIRGSIIVTDPSGELYKETSKYQESIGRSVYRINFSNPSFSDKYNLLENCKDEQEVIELSSSLLTNGSLSIELSTGKKTGGIEWVQMAEPLLASALLYAKDLKYPYNNVEFAFQLLLTLPTHSLYKLIESSKNINAITQFNIFLQVGGADRTEGSIKITMSTNMKSFTDKSVNSINSKTTFNIDNFRKDESILYISYPERKSNHYAPFIAPFFNSIINKISDNYKKTDLSVHLMFDEFANIGMLNNMSLNLATVRKKRISFLICLQSISQLNQIYGINNTKSILNNLKTKILLPGCSDIDTLNYISSLCGNIEMTIESNNKSINGVSVNKSKTKRKMFEDGELRAIKDGLGLVLISNRQPVLDTMEMYFENNKYTRNVFDTEVIQKEDTFTLNDINKEIKKLKIELQSQQDSEESEDFGKGLFTR